jgi:hypothetical protein
LGPLEVQKLLDGMETEVDTIKKTAIQLCWYMRGGISYNDVMNMSAPERIFITELIEKNLETTKNTKMPFF